MDSSDISSSLRPSEKKFPATGKTKDSLELTALVRAVYTWHETKRTDDFPYKYRKQNDSIFTGIDWGEFNKNLKEFRKTQLFSEAFLLNHKDIAVSIDSSIKKTDITYRNIRDGITIWESGADDWCLCQDYPDDYWELITIDSLTVKNTTASFYWTWDKKSSPNQHKVRATAIKSADKWQLNSLEGFKPFLNGSDIDTAMK